MQSNNKPLVSVVTGTWRRHDLLAEAIENIRSQDYPNIEHCIASDGPDPELAKMIAEMSKGYSDIPIKFVECGRNWSSFLEASYSAVPFQVAQWMASGTYVVWLADDERMEPDHISSLVTLLEETQSDFVYSKCLCWFNPSLVSNMSPSIIGTDPPQRGSITNVLYRAEVLDYRGFEVHVGSGTDWDQVLAWVEAGARWAMSDKVSISHRVDKLGEGDVYRAHKQPLRGHTPLQLLQPTNIRAEVEVEA